MSTAIIWFISLELLLVYELCTLCGTASNNWALQMEFDRIFVGIAEIKLILACKLLSSDNYCENSSKHNVKLLVIIY